MASAQGEIGTYEGEMAFARVEDAIADARRPGLLRARPLDLATVSRDSFDFRRCRIHDLSAATDFRPDLFDHGFTTADLSGLGRLQAALERVRVAGRIGAEDEAAIRRGLRGASLPLGDGRRLRILFIAPEGLILRQAGPDGMSAYDGIEAAGGSPNGARPDAAVNVHADQDVGGTPVRQILRGTGPWLFRHESPQGANRRSPVMLVNLWIPLQQATRPLALMDARSVDRRRHQLRFELPTDSFLERDPDRLLNDIWFFLHDPAQRWYFTSEIDARRAYVFNTLGTPHGAFALPGEDAARRRHGQLRRALDAVARGDAGALADAARKDDAAPVETTRPLRRAIEAMDALLAEAAANPAALCAGNGRATDWNARARAALDRVIRRSVEMRAVGWVTR